MNNVKALKHQKHILSIFSNITIVLQIVATVLVVLFSLYMFLRLLNNHVLDFLNPLVGFTKSLIHSILGGSIKSARAELDAELSAAVLINIILVFVFSQVKTVLKRQDEELDKKIVEEKRIEEQEFNMELKSELNRSVKSYDSYMLGFTLKASPLVAESLQIYGEEKLDVDKVQSEALAKFIEVAKGIQGVEVVQKGAIVLVTSSKFESVDLVLSTVCDAVTRLKKEYKEQKIIVKTRFAIEAYKSVTSSKQVYQTVKPLLELNASSDILCYGNFNNRYALLKSPKFDVVVKGKYDIDAKDQTVWALVKKL